MNWGQFKDPLLPMSYSLCGNTLVSSTEVASLNSSFYYKYLVTEFIEFNTNIQGKTQMTCSLNA